MGNIRGYLRLLLVVDLVFLVYSSALANDVVDSLKHGIDRNMIRTGVENLKTDTDKKTVFLETNCTISFNSLSYVGVKMQGSPSCRGGEWQCAMRDAAIDPFDKELNSSAPPKPGMWDVYYYCTDGLGPVNSKKYICLNRAPNESSFKQINQNIEFKWDEASGKCNCALKGVENTSQRCDQAPPKFTEEQIAQADKVNGTGQQPPPDTATNPSGDQTTAPATAATKPPPPPKPTVPTAELSDCVKGWVAASDDCKAAALAAQKSCDGGDQERKEAKEAQAVIDGTKNVYIQSKTGAGAQQQCFIASVITSGTRDAVTKMYASCNSDIVSCNNRCRAETIQQFQTKCEALVAAPGHEDADSPNRKLFSSTTQNVNANMVLGGSVCTEDAKKKQSDLSKMLTNLGTALTDSVRCICKMSVNGLGGAEQNCDYIPPVAQCEQNPNANGCQVYAGISVCSVGLNYNSHLCACQSNPKAAGCPGGPNSGTLSNFGNAINMKDSSGNIVAFGPFSNSGVKGSNFDVSGSTAASVFDGLGGGDQGVLHQGPSSLSAPGGAGASNSSGGELEDRSQNSAAGESNRGVSGLLNQAKNFVKKALGMDNAPSKPNGDLVDANKKDKNSDKFKPRGMSSDSNASGIGRKNMDIWKMMNMCTSAERCKTVENSYILGP